jgi:opacity protein-like surface antigen
MLRTRLGSHRAAGRRRAGSTCWPILAPASAVALMAGAPSAAYAQCFGQFNAITSVAGTVNTAFLPSGSAFLSSSPNSAPDQQGGGVWTRGVAGSVDTSSNTTINSSFTVLGSPPPPVQISTPCRATVKQDFAGFETGHDIAALNVNNAEWHFGVLAGYVGAKIQFPGQNAEVPAQDGALQAPSAGLYASFSKGNFSADVQGRVYYLQAESLGQRLDGRGFSLAGNMSYRFDLPGNWSLEPSVGGIFSRTSVDPLNVATVGGTIPASATGIPGLTGTLLVAESGTLQFQDVDSFLGRASIKLGTSFPLAGGQIIAYPFATASVFHEFEGTAAATFAQSGTVVGIPIPFQGTSSLTASGVGTYGQFGGGSAFQFANTGWLGYARFDYRTGENVQGYSVSAGLRYQLDAENRARRPDMVVKARPAADGYDWSGPYMGASAGSTWGRTHWAFQGATTDPDFAGVLVGGQAGYNFQKGRIVGGIEGDAGWSNAHGAAPCTNNPLFFSCEADVGLLGSLTARFGYTWGRALFYAKGGWAFGEVTARTALNFVDPGVAQPPAAASTVAQSTNWENGWTVGAGMEFALTDRWSAKAEYMHYGFPRYAFTVMQNAPASATAAGNTVRIGVNYHFAPR